MTSPGAGSPQALVWDLWIRSFHWLLVALIGLAWWTYRADLMSWHRRIGYAIAALLVFRIYWGFAGSTTARFADFVRAPIEVIGYFRGRTRSGAGHNPAGGWSVLALLATLVLVVASGLLGTTQEGDSGRMAALAPFAWSRAATHVHVLAFEALLALVGLHLAAVLAYQLRGHDLMRPMLSGRKRLAPGIEVPAAAPHRFGSIGFVLALGVYVALAVFDGG